MNAPLRSASFPNGLPELRSEAQVRATRTLACPFCGTDPNLASMAPNGRFHVCCENEDCAAQPYVSGNTLTQVSQCWNNRGAL